MAINVSRFWLLVSSSVTLCFLKRALCPQVYPDISQLKLFFLGIAGSFILWGLYKVFIFPRFVSPFRHLPIPKGGLPILAHGAATLELPGGQTFLRIMNETPNDGLVRVPGYFYRENILLTSPLALAEVLVHKSYDFVKPPEVRDFLRIILGDGLIVLEGDEHKFHRKHVSPAFSFRHIKELYPIFWSKAIELTRCIAAEIYENPEQSSDPEKSLLPHSIVEINHWANKVTMDIIGLAGLGCDFHTLLSSDHELIRNYEEILEPTWQKGLYFAAHLIVPRWFIELLPWKLNTRLKATTTAIKDICHQLIRDKKELMKVQEDQQLDILSLLIKSNNFADGMLVDQLLTFLAAGHETTSSAFTWGTYLLAQHPTIQTRLRTEIHTHLPSPSSKIAIDFSSTLESLPYLSATCNEILRLYPTVPTTIRIAIRPTSVLDHPMPPGSRIHISPWAINRSAHLWGSDAGEFKPERWLETDPVTAQQRCNNTGGVSSNYAQMTFLHGPRSCIGERFAKGELRALIAAFVGAFEVGLEREGQVAVPGGVITSKPRDGMRLRLGVLNW